MSDSKQDLLDGARFEILVLQMLLRRLLATRQGRTVGYEPPEVQALWREVADVLDEKAGSK